MSKNTKRILIIAVVGCIVGIYIFFAIKMINRNNTNPEDQEGIQNTTANPHISAIYEISNHYVRVNQYFYTGYNSRTNNSHLSLVNGRNVQSLENEYNVSFYNDIVLVKEANNATSDDVLVAKVYDKDGKKLFDKEKVNYAIDETNHNIVYYSTDTIYDSKFKKIMDTQVSVNTNGKLFNDYLYIDEKGVYDLKNKIKLVAENQEFQLIDNYLLFKANNKYYLIDTVKHKVDNSYTAYDCYTREIEYEVVDNASYCKLYKGNEVSYLANNQITTGKIKIDDNLYADYNSCTVGAKLSNGTSPIDGLCHLSYKKISDKVIIGYESEDTGNNNLYVDSKRITQNNSSVNAFDKTITVESNSIKRTYDINGKVLFGSAIAYYNKNNTYSVFNNSKVKVYDSNLQEILTEYPTIDDYVCNKYNYCSLGINGNYYLLYNNKKVDSTAYVKIEVDDNYIVLSTLLNSYLLIMGEGEQVLNVNRPYLGVNLETVISKGKLDDIKDEINKDKEFYQTYAYIAQTNSNKIVNEYVSFFYAFIRPILKNKKVINTNNLLKSLKTLKINDTDTDKGSVDSAYYPEVNEIKFKQNANKEKLLMRELFRWLDANANNPGENYIYLCSDQKYYDEDKGNCEVQNIPESKFMIDTGSKYYSAKYYGSNYSESSIALNIYKSLAEIFGEDKMEEIYVSADTDYLLAKLFMDNGISFNNYETINNDLTAITYPNSKSNYKVLNDYRVILSSLYKRVHPNIDYDKDTTYQNIISRDYK